MHPTVDPATFFLNVYALMSSPLLQNPSVCPCGHWQAQQCIQSAPQTSCCGGLTWRIPGPIFRDVLQNENCNFRISPGTRCEKNGACSRISTRKFVWTAFFANNFFVSRSDFREVNPVVRLVQSSGSVGSLRSNGFVGIFFFRFRLRWCSVDRRLLDFGEWIAGWFFEPVAAVDGNRFHFDLAMDLILRFADRKSSASTLLRRCHRLHEKAVGEEWSARIFHHNPTRNHPNLAADPKQCKLRGKVDRPV